ncbi:MAG: hypothetical protein ACLR5H_10125 [Oscillospiraceae bacterium]
MTTPSEPSLVQLWLHGGLDLSEQLQKEPPGVRLKASPLIRPPAPGPDAGGMQESTGPCGCTTMLAGLLCVVLSALMLLTAADLPLRLRCRPHRQRGSPALCGAGHGGDRRGEHRGGHDPWTTVASLRHPGRVL